MSALIEDARRIHAAAVAGAMPGVLLPRLLAHVGTDALAPRTLASYRRVRIVGAGKAALAMAGAIEPVLDAAGVRAVDGEVVVPDGYAARIPAGVRAPTRIAVREAAHPLPDAPGAAAARAALARAEACGPQDLLLVLLSGGASALWAAPAPGLPPDDVRAVVERLQRAGADNAALNTVRRQLSLLGGGRLAAATRADVATLVLSDVVGDDPGVVGSGPTVRDRTTPADAVRVLRAHDAWESASAAVRARLQRASPPVAPSSGTRTLHLLGGVGDALAAARVAAASMGYDVTVCGAALRGEARDAGRTVARRAIARAVAGAAAGARPGCLLWGGETTVTVRGAGRGGRNQELALAAALVLDDAVRATILRDDAAIVVLSAGTDGIDGPTDAAGGWATPRTVAHAESLGRDATAALLANDAYGLLDAPDARDPAGGLLRTGPTHTNVMDVQIALVRP
ncbi:MAG: glycerate kinase type-2 family protein [Gemmatirosa sp.]